MFIAITRSGQIELQDAANFRAFKIFSIGAAKVALSLRPRSTVWRR